MVMSNFADADDVIQIGRRDVTKSHYTSNINTSSTFLTDSPPSFVVDVMIEIYIRS